MDLLAAPNACVLWSAYVWGADNCVLSAIYHTPLSSLPVFCLVSLPLCIRQGDRWQKGSENGEEGRKRRSTEVVPGSSPSHLSSLPAPSSTEGGMSSGLALAKLLESVSAITWSLRKKRAEEGAGWVMLKEALGFLLPGLERAVCWPDKELCVCCFCGWFAVGVAFLYPDFSPKSCVSQ